jgi:O-methyltransferase
VARWLGNWGVIRRSEYDELRQLIASHSHAASMEQHIRAQLKDTDPAFSGPFEGSKAYTMTGTERLYALYASIKYIVAARIPGELIETGVWRGGSGMMMALTLLQLGAPDRTIRLFDTFEGHPEPDAEKDIDLWGTRGVDQLAQHKKQNPGVGWGAASIEEVRANLDSTGYPPHLVKLVKGMVEETAPRNVPDRIALLRLDTDWYASTRASLEAFYDRLERGGVLLIDDYGHYQGKRQAVDEFLAERAQSLLLTRIDYGCRLAIKC